MHAPSRAVCALALVISAPSFLEAQKVAAPTGVTVACAAAPLTVQWNNMAGATQYVVNQRSGGSVQTLATVQSSPYSGTLPPPGSYEFQVVSVGKGRSNTAGSSWIGCAVPMPSTTSGGTIITEPRPGTGTITPMIAGPTGAWAATNTPGQIVVSWREVTGAARYRVTRSSTKPEAVATITEQPVSGFFCQSGTCTWTNAPVELPWTYTYTIYALVPNSTGALTLSTASPPASTTSITGPTGLKYGVTLTGAPGKVNVTLSWDPLPNAIKYALTGLDIAGQPTVVITTNSYAVSNITAGVSFRVCVSGIWTGDIADPARNSCIDVVLK